MNMVMLLLYTFQLLEGQGSMFDNYRLILKVTVTSEVTVTWLFSVLIRDKMGSTTGGEHGPGMDTKLGASLHIIHT
jgi:hypothetical protein